MTGITPWCSHEQPYICEKCLKCGACCSCSPPPALIHVASKKAFDRARELYRAKVEAG